MEQRKAKRIIKRLEVKFNTGVENTAITSDLSENGMFIRTNRGAEHGSVINIKLNPPNARELFLTGKVVRVSGQCQGLLGGVKSGMGVQLISPPLDYMNYVQSILN
ncbi:MAG: PilZ domain-containing protein [Nitrospirae bacterium]|nr:PilZ domain-containing protein [Nitrospirota bacterium]